MIVKVGTHKTSIEKELVNEQEINVTKCTFEFVEEITEDFVKEAYFTLNGKTYKQVIVNNECDIPQEVLAKKGTVVLGVTAKLTDNEEELKRYNPSPSYFNTLLGSLVEDAENSEPITPSEFDQYMQALNDGLNEVSHVDIDAEKVGNKTTVSITNRDNVTKNVEVYDGDSGITVFKIENGHLIATSESGSNLTNYSLSNGHLWLTIGE